MNPDKVSRDGLYPVVDVPAGLSPTLRQHLRARWTGERRRVIKPGEYYLSGAAVEAYRAPLGTLEKYHPAELVIVYEKVEYIVTPLVKLVESLPLRGE